MNWEEYEQRIFEELRRRYPNTCPQWNVKVVGSTTKSPRQIDILIETQVLDSSIRIVVDAKDRKTPIDVNEVESFIAMMNDVKAHRGILVAANGYTKTAIARAHNEPNQDIELDVFTLAELESFQGETAIPFRGSSGVIIEAPFGWVVDALSRPTFPACLYQRGYNLDSAGDAKEWMYVNFWRKESHSQTLEEVLSLQTKGILSVKPDSKITLMKGVERDDAKSVIRWADIPGYPTPEITGLIEFKEFIFFAVLFTPIETSKRNLRKLRELLRTAIPIEVDNQTGVTKSRKTSDPRPSWQYPVE